MEPWKKKKSLMRGAVKFSVVFDPLEREVLGELAATVANSLIARCQSVPKDELAELTGMTSGHTEPPTEATLRRLLPDFERDGDEEYEGDNGLLRSLHEVDICKAKISNLMVITTALGPDGSVNVTASEGEAHAWLAALNDMRLYLSALPADQDSSLAVDRESVVEWLAFNQDSLLDALMGEA